MFNDSFLQFLNLYLFIMDAVILGVLNIFLYKVRKYGWRSPSVQLAFAMGLYIGGHALIRGWTWFWRFTEANALWPTANRLVEVVPVVPVGLVVATVGLVWLSYRLYDTLSVRLWMLVAVGAAVMAAVVTWGFQSFLIGIAVIVFVILLAALRFIEHPR